MMRDPLKRFLCGAIISMYGDWLTTVALVVLLLRVTGSSAAPAGYMVARVVPRIVGAGPGGWLADRHGGARVVACCAVVQGALTASIIPAGHARAVWAIFAAVCLGQLCQGASRAALGTVIPAVTHQGALGPANALFNIGQATALVIAPAVAAPLLVWRGPDLLLALDAASFGLAALVMLTLPPHSYPPQPGRPLRGGMLGLSLVSRDPTLRMLAVAYFAGSMAATVGGSVLVLAAALRFGGAYLVGVLYAAVGAGDLLGGLITLWRRPPRDMRFAITGLGSVAVTAIAGLVVAPAIWIAVIVLGLSGLAETGYVSWGATDMQLRVGAAVLGRVNGVIVLAQSLGMVVGAVSALLLVPRLGWERALTAACCASLAVLALGILGGRRPARAPLASVSEPYRVTR